MNHKFSQLTSFKDITLWSFRVYFTIMLSAVSLINGENLKAYDDILFASFPKKVTVNIPTVNIDNSTVLGMMNEVAEIGTTNNLLTSDDVVVVIFSRDRVTDPESSKAIFYIKKKSIFRFNLIWGIPFSFDNFFGSFNYQHVNFIISVTDHNIPSGISFSNDESEPLQVQYFIDTFMIKSDDMGTKFEYQYDDESDTYCLKLFTS